MRKIEAWILDENETLADMRREYGGTQATHRAELIIRLVKDDMAAIEVLKSRYSCHGLYRHASVEDGSV